MFDRSKSIFFKEEQEAKARKIEADAQNRVLTNAFYLTLNFPMTRTYGTSIKYYDTNKVQPDRRLDYEIQVDITPDREHYHRWDLRLFKSHLFINRHEPDLVSEILASRIMEGIFPIQVKIDNAYHLLDGITNLEEIKANWEKAKHNIRTKYEGDIVEKIIEKVELKVTNRYQLEYSLDKDMLWQAMFHPILGMYELDLTRHEVFRFPIHNQVIFFEGLQFVDTLITDYDTYKIRFEGIDSKRNTLKAVYDIDTSTNLLKYMVVNWKSADEAQKIDFSAYETTVRPALDMDSKEDNSIPAIKKKRSFWDFLD